MKEVDYEEIISELTVIASIKAVVSVSLKTEKKKNEVSFRYEHRNLNKDIFFNIVNKSKSVKKYGYVVVYPIMVKYASVLKKNIAASNASAYTTAKNNAELRYWLTKAGI